MGDIFIGDLIDLIDTGPSFPNEELDSENGEVDTYEDLEDAPDERLDME